jgi:hypothetical protein
MLVTMVVFIPRKTLEIRAFCHFYLLFSSVICVMTEAIDSAYSYTAVGIFVMVRLFREAWGRKAPKMQVEFNDFLEVIISSLGYFVLCTFYSW